MTVLVTGGAGYIGSHMVHALVDAGESVVVLDNLSTGFRFLLPRIVPLIAGSTGDRELAARILRQHDVDAIMHFAASIVVPDSVRDPLGYYRNNTLNTCNLLDVAIANGVKHFIFSSTAAVYGNAERVPVREDDPKNADLALWHLEIDVGDHAARCRSLRMGCATWCCATSMSPAPIRRGAPVSRRRRRRT